MKKLIKTIVGQDCEIYAISHHNRLRVGRAVPYIEIYENSVEVPTIGSNRIQYRHTDFSVVICPDAEMDMAMNDEMLKGLTEFELSMYLPNKRGILTPFELCGVNAAELTDEQWIFDITDTQTVKKLLTL